jgi:hypothetical protein
MAGAFVSTGRPFLHQLEIQIQHNQIPIWAHLDFVFVEQNEAGTVHIQVVECKSCENIPETAYASREMQIYGQVGLLQSCWNTPCFSLPEKMASGKQRPVTFPILIKEALGLTLLENANETIITGCILCISMNEAKAFGPYYPNELMLNACLGLGENIWKSMAVQIGALHLLRRQFVTV